MAKGFKAYETWQKANKHGPIQGQTAGRKNKISRTSGPGLWKNSKRVKSDHLCLTRSLIEI